jgi:ABC-2 type transport system permease protein
MTNVRLFLHGCLLQYRALFNWASPLGYATYKVLVPATQVIFFTQLGIFATGRTNSLYFAVGNALQLTAINGIYGVVMTVGNERRYGTLPFLLASPANRLATFLGRALFHILDGISSVVISFAIAALLFGLDLGHSNLPLLAGCVLLISATTCGLGLMFGSLSLITRDVLTIANVAFYLVMVFCGIDFAVGRLPVWGQVISAALPMTRGVQAAREAVTGAPLHTVAGLLVGEIAVGIVYVALGYALFRWLENRARLGGMQEAY